MIRLLPIALAALASAPVMAQSAPTKSMPADANKPEMDRMVCERQVDIGSRLAARKVCKTVREWEEERRVQRDHVERVQQIKNNAPSL